MDINSQAKDLRLGWHAAGVHCPAVLCSAITKGDWTDPQGPFQLLIFCFGCSKTLWHLQLCPLTTGLAHPSNEACTPPSVRSLSQGSQGQARGPTGQPFISCHPPWPWRRQARQCSSGCLAARINFLTTPQTRCHGSEPQETSKSGQRQRGRFCSSESI